MAQWYVKNGGGGSNNGTSWTDAWTSFASVVWGGGGVVAGDFLNVDGGTTSVTYTSRWTVGASGTLGNPITIRTGQDANHNGTVIFDFEAGDSATGNGITCNRNYVTLDGFVNGLSKMQINNIRNTSNRTACYGFFGGSSGNTGITVTYVTSSNCNNPIKIQLSTGCEVSYCTLQARGDAVVSMAGSTGTFGANSVHHCNLEILFNDAVGGPDGIQTLHGVDTYSNFIYITETGITTSNQHPDMIQQQGNYNRHYDTHFLNVADSAIDIDCFANPDLSNTWIYNNLFEITTAIDPFPEFIRIYVTGVGNTIDSITNLKIMNNTFANCNNWFAVTIGLISAGNPFGSGGAPTTSGFEFRNNVFYNCGNGSSFPILLIRESSNWVIGDFTAGMSNNVYWKGSGTQYICVDSVIGGAGQFSIANWIATHEATATSSQPTFVDPSNGNYNIDPTDTVCLGTGANLSAYFTGSYNGVTRTVPWDRGAAAFFDSADALTIGALTSESMQVGF